MNCNYTYNMKIFIPLDLKFLIHFLNEHLGSKKESSLIKLVRIKFSLSNIVTLIH